MLLNDRVAFRFVPENHRRMNDLRVVRWSIKFEIITAPQSAKKLSTHKRPVSFLGLRMNPVPQLAFNTQSTNAHSRPLARLSITPFVRKVLFPPLVNDRRVGKELIGGRLINDEPQSPGMVGIL